MKAVVFLILVSCGSVVAPTEPATSPIAEVLAHTVLLKDPGCTGVRIGGGIVVTAKHCTEDKAIGQAYSDYVLAYESPDHDFALLSGDKEIAPVALVDADIGAHVYIVGYPTQIDDGKQQLTVTDGVYTGANSRGMQRITAPAYYGNSGGGVWDNAGELYGILVEMRPVDLLYHDKFPVPFPGYSYMVPIGLIRAVVN